MNQFFSWYDRNALGSKGPRCEPIATSCNESYYDKSIRHLDARSGEHIGVSPGTGKKVKSSNNSAICDNLLDCNSLPSFGNFSVLAHENKRHLLEIKESLLIMRDKPLLNRNINSALLYLFDKVS